MPPAGRLVAGLAAMVVALAAGGLAGGGGAVWAQGPAPATAPSSTWFTVLGDPTDPGVNTVQVDPVDRDNDPRTMRVRVSRSENRTSWDGVPYRSYTSNVFFDCEHGTARYLSITYYSQANWRGEAGKTVDYTTGPVRPMAFTNVSPNPTQRIVHAACSLVAKR